MEELLKDMTHDEDVCVLEEASLFFRNPKANMFAKCISPVTQKPIHVSHAATETVSGY